MQSEYNDLNSGMAKRVQMWKIKT